MNKLFHVSIATHNIIFCELHDDVAEYVCVIQAVYSGADTCTSCPYLNCTENNFITNASDSQDISHLPQNSAFCFIAIAVRNASKIIQLGTFTTEAGTIMYNRYIVLYSCYLITFVQKEYLGHMQL